MSDAKLSIVDADHLPTYPEGVRWDIDIPADSTPLRIVDHAVRKYADKNSIDFLGRKITYREFGQMIDDTARGLQAQGVGPGTKVGLHMPNSPYFLVMLMATWRAGATAVTYSVLEKNKEKMKAQIADSGTTFMATLDVKDFYNPVMDLVDQGALQKVIRCPLMDVLPEEKARPAKKIAALPAPVKSLLLSVMGLVPSLKKKAEDLKTLYGKLAPEAPKNDTRVITFDKLQVRNGAVPAGAGAQDTAVLQYTSGTTGTLKAAMLQQFNLAANTLQIAEFFKAPSATRPGEALMEPGKEKVFLSIPMDHIFALQFALAALDAGAELALYADGRDVPGSLKTIERTGSTILPTVPKLIQTMNALPDFKSYDTSSVKVVIAGSEALPKSARDQFPVEIMEGYGQTEMSPVISCNLQGAFNAVGSLGIIAPRTEAKVTEFGNPDRILPVGEVGELVVRGPQRMTGYYNKPEDNKAVFTNDGWLRTGDLVRMDEQLRPIFVDRAKRMGKINGNGVSPLEIELAAAAHPAVLEAVCVFLKDASSGQAAELIVRLKENEKLTADEVRQYLKDDKGLAGIQIPKFVKFTDQPLLRNAMQKIDWYKIQLAEQAAVDQAKQQPPSARPAP